MALEFSSDPITATTIQAGYGRFVTVNGDLPIVFLNIGTVSSPNVIYALTADQARAVAQEIIAATS